MCTKNCIYHLSQRSNLESLALTFTRLKKMKRLNFAPLLKCFYNFCKPATRNPTLADALIIPYFRYFEAQMLISILTWETTEDDTTLHMVNGAVRNQFYGKVCYRASNMLPKVSA